MGTPGRNPAALEHRGLAYQVGHEREAGGAIGRGWALVITAMDGVGEQPRDPAAKKPSPEQPVTPHGFSYLLFFLQPQARPG